MELQGYPLGSSSCICGENLGFDWSVGVRVATTASGLLNLRRCCALRLDGKLL